MKDSIAVKSFCYFSAALVLASEVSSLAQVSNAQQPVAHANTDVASKPTLPISEAARLAQAELEKRGLAEKHFISGITYLRGVGEESEAFYLVRLTPPLFRAVDARSTNDLVSSQMQVGFRIDMDGKLSESAANLPTSLRRRILRQSSTTHSPGTGGTNAAPPVKVLKGDGDQSQVEFEQESAASTNDSPTSLRRRILRQKLKQTNDVERITEPVLKPATNRSPASTSSSP